MIMKVGTVVPPFFIEQLRVYWPWPFWGSWGVGDCLRGSTKGKGFTVW